MEAILSVLLKQQGFESITPDALALFVYHVDRFFSDLILLSKLSAELQLRSKICLIDINEAFLSSQLSPTDLFYHVLSLNSSTLKLPPLKFRSSDFSTITACDYERIDSRPIYIPPYLPRFPEKHSFIWSTYIPEILEDHRGKLTLQNTQKLLAEENLLTLDRESTENVGEKKNKQKADYVNSPQQQSVVKRSNAEVESLSKSVTREFIKYTFLNKLPNDIAQLSQAQIKDVIREINWEKVSKEVRTRSALSCQKKYKSLIISNKSTWAYSTASNELRLDFTHPEKKKLTKLVKKYENADEKWNKIAREMSTDTCVKSPLQCFQAFKRWRAANDAKWNKEEDFSLEQLVYQYGINSWAQVAKGMENRNSSQCRFRYVAISKLLKKGAWSAAEDELLLSITKSISQPDFQILQFFVPHRNAKQCRDRYNTLKRRELSQNANSSSVIINAATPPVFDPQQSFHFQGTASVEIIPPIQIQPPNYGADANTPKVLEIGRRRAERSPKFTEEEKERLIQQYKFYRGPKWSKMVSVFPGRTDTYLRQQWKRLGKDVADKVLEEIAALPPN
ncbi:hypothetical protein HK098_007893 [Nowakowskiella sp. JEL0407]|nr:hypothetical protein HK098_007893 [Nowakowskiella sp. JEL0407]